METLYDFLLCKAGKGFWEVTWNGYQKNELPVLMVFPTREDARIAVRQAYN